MGGRRSFSELVKGSPTPGREEGGPLVDRMVEISILAGKMTLDNLHLKMEMIHSWVKACKLIRGKSSTRWDDGKIVVKVVLKEVVVPYQCFSDLAGEHEGVLQKEVDKTSRMIVNKVDCGQTAQAWSEEYSN